MPSLSILSSIAPDTYWVLIALNWISCLLHFALVFQRLSGPAWVLRARIITGNGMLVFHVNWPWAACYMGGSTWFKGAGLRKSMSWTWLNDSFNQCRPIELLLQFFFSISQTAYSAFQSPFTWSENTSNILASYLTLSLLQIMRFLWIKWHILVVLEKHQLSLCLG